MREKIAGKKFHYDSTRRGEKLLDDKLFLFFLLYFPLQPNNLNRKALTERRSGIRLASSSERNWGERWKRQVPFSAFLSELSLFSAFSFFSAVVFGSFRFLVMIRRCCRSLLKFRCRRWAVKVTCNLHLFVSFTPGTVPCLPVTQTGAVKFNFSSRSWWISSTFA